MTSPRVFALVPDCHVAGWRYGDVWRSHFYDGLRAAGAEVLTPVDLAWDWARPVQSRTSPDTESLARSSASLLRQILDHARLGLDAVLSYCFSHDLDLAVIDEVKAAGIPWINFFCDSMYAFHTVEALARRTSLNWFVEVGAQSRYEALGVRWVRAPYAVNGEALPDASCLRPRRTLSFVGTAHRDRIRACVMLRLMGMDLHVRGWGWPELVTNSGAKAVGLGPRLRQARRLCAGRFLRDRIGGHLDGGAFIEYLQESQLVPGLNEGRDGKGEAVSYLKLRDIEFPGMACAYVTQRNEDVDLAFEDGREVRTFESLAELREVVRELLEDPHESRRMGQRARARVLGEHTWASRLPQLLEAVA